MTEKHQPIVSIFMETYNSEETVLDTLKSIYNQTYPNLELIISDDCSSDNTVKICRDWIEKHKERFVRTELLTIEKNTGVTANCKRAESACSSEWLKDMAADDIMLPNCIERYMNYVNENPDTIYLFSKVEVFGEDENKVSIFRDSIFDYSFFNLTIEKQMEWCVAGPPQPIPAATGFYNKKALDKLGVIYDERIPMLEDAPRWIQCLEAGVHFKFIDEVLVKYRISIDSICSGEKHSLAFRHSRALHYLYYKFPRNIKYIGKKEAYKQYIISKALVSKNPLWKILNLGRKLLNQPQKIYKKLIKIYENR